MSALPMLRQDGHGPARPAGPSRRLYGRLERVARAAGIPAGPGDETRVTETDIAGLPSPVQRYLRFMDVVGRPRDWSFRVRFAGRFRMRPGMGWLPAQAWQYNSAITVSRVFVMRVLLAGALPMTGRDTYVSGHGQMTGRLLGVIPVVNSAGAEMDIGELTTYLNDALLVAPSFLLRPEVSWAEVSDKSFDVTLSDGGHQVTGRMFLDEHGAPADFATTDRFAALPGGLRRAEWRTPIREWTSPHGRPLPGRSRAVWRLDEGEFSYIEGCFDPASIAYNVSPTTRAGF